MLFFIYVKNYNKACVPAVASLITSPFCYCRVCGHSKESIKTLRSCDQPYSSGTEKGCYLNATVEDDICILVDSDAGMSTFKPELGWCQSLILMSLFSCCENK